MCEFWLFACSSERVPSYATQSESDVQIIADFWKLSAVIVVEYILRAQKLCPNDKDMDV